MTSADINLCGFVIREHFGEVAEKMVLLLLRKKYIPMKLIASDTGLPLDKVKKSLVILIQHNIVQYEKSKQGFVEYYTDAQSILMCLYFPQFIHCAKKLYGEEAEYIVEELLHHGRMTMSNVVDRVTTRLSQQSADEGSVSVFSVRDRFIDLNKAQFVQRCPALQKGAVPTPAEEDPRLMAFAVPDLNLSGIAKRKRSRIEDSPEAPSKKRKLERTAVECGDEGIYWVVNHSRFLQYRRDEAIINAVSQKIDHRAGQIVRTLLVLSEVRTEPDAVSTNPVTYNEIFNALPKDLGVTKQILDQYMKIITDDAKDFVQKAGDSGGGQFIINFLRAFTHLCQAHVESVVREKYGSKCLRVYRLLVLKGHLEQKQVEEMAMIPAKEAKEMLYILFEHSMVTLIQVPKTPDHAPSRTIYLFGIDLNQVARILQQKTIKTLFNMCCRREHETREHHRLLDKQQRLLAIIDSLEQNGTLTEAQKAEIDENITPAEKAQLEKVKAMTDKLDMCEVQVCETLFVLETFLKYAHAK